MQRTALFSTLFAASLAAAQEHAVGFSENLGLAKQAGVNRDSCVSTKFGGRLLWNCRDSQPLDNNGVPILPVTVNTAAWSNFNSDGTSSFEQTGDSARVFFPLPDGACNGDTAGGCGDETRYVGWPDSAPIVLSDTVAYSFVNLQHLEGLTLADDSINYSNSLYKLELDGDNLPKTTLVNKEFWGADDAPYGAYGGFLHEGKVYLYGQRNDHSVAITRVDSASIEDKSRYEYYVDGGWTSNKPSREDAAATIPNAGAGGQGTFYYSDAWQEFVWIGSVVYPGASWHLTTAPAPEGPWEQAYQIHEEPGGTAPLPAYSCVAHPAMSSDLGKEMYLSFTNVTRNTADVYTTPVIRIEWA